MFLESLAGSGLLAGGLLLTAKEENLQRAGGLWQDPHSDGRHREGVGPLHKLMLPIVADGGSRTLTTEDALKQAIQV